MDAFQEWVSKRLIEINKETDLCIFVPYVISILEDGEEDSLIEIIKDITGDNEVDFLSVSKELMNKWNEINLSNGCTKDKIAHDASKSLDAKMHDIIAQQNSDSANQFSSYSSRSHVNDKDNIVSRYGEISDGEEDESVEPSDAIASKEKKSKSIFSSTTFPLDDLLVKNTNAQLIKDREKQVREQARVDAEVKKVKDKEDKDRQKVKDIERKDAEKKRTQKGERRR